MKPTTTKILIALICFLTLFFWVLLIHQKESNPALFTDLLFLLLLAIISISDIKTLTLPDSCHIGIFLLGLISYFLKQDFLFSRFLGFFVISLPFFLLAIWFGGFGGGDIKLSAACGFYLGASLVTLGSLLGAILAAFYGIYLLLSHKATGKDCFFFAPFLSLGYAISLLFGEQLLASYLILLA